MYDKYNIYNIFYIICIKEIWYIRLGKCVEKSKINVLILIWLKYKYEFGRLIIIVWGLK